MLHAVHGNACAAQTAPCVILSTSGATTDPNSPTCTTAQLTANWQQYSLSIPAGQLASVKDFFKATFIFTDPPLPAPGQGGVVYFDQIQYQP